MHGVWDIFKNKSQPKGWPSFLTAHDPKTIGVLLELLEVVNFNYSFFVLHSSKVWASQEEGLQAKKNQLPSWLGLSFDWVWALSLSWNRHQLFSWWQPDIFSNPEVRTCCSTGTNLNCCLSVWHFRSWSNMSVSFTTKLTSPNHWLQSLQEYDEMQALWPGIQPEILTQSIRIWHPRNKTQQPTIFFPRIAIPTLKSNQCYLYRPKSQAYCLSRLHNLYSERHPRWKTCLVCIQKLSENMCGQIFPSVSLFSSNLEYTWRLSEVVEEKELDLSCCVSKNIVSKTAFGIWQGFSFAPWHLNTTDVCCQVYLNLASQVCPVTWLLSVAP